MNIFNILLRVYNFNEMKVVPSEFLEKMKDNGVNPNLVSLSLLGWNSCVNNIFLGNICSVD